MFAPLTCLRMQSPLLWLFRLQQLTRHRDRSAPLSLLDSPGPSGHAPCCRVDPGGEKGSRQVSKQVSNYSWRCQDEEGVPGQKCPHPRSRLPGSSELPGWTDGSHCSSWSCGTGRSEATDTCRGGGGPLSEMHGFGFLFCFQKSLGMVVFFLVDFYRQLIRISFDQILYLN